MKSLLSLILFAMTLSGCTVYKSEGRKQFESEGARKVVTPSALEKSNENFKLVSCKKENRLETWFNEEFPSVNYEMVVVDSDLEIWRTHRGSLVEIKALQKTPTATTSCIYHFANDIVWNLYKNQFVRELENNLMTLD